MRKFLLLDERGNYIFIVEEFDSENIARKLPILTGKSFEYKTEILRGLVGDELIIDTRGEFTKPITFPELTKEIKLILCM